MSLFDLRDRVRADLAGTPQRSDATAVPGEQVARAGAVGAEQLKAETSGKVRHYAETLKHLFGRRPARGR